MSRALALAILLLVLAPLALALDGDAILRQVDRKLNPESYEMYRKLINIEPDGRKKEFVLFTVKKGRDKMVALFLDPPSEKGRATLRLGDNMWLYIPNVGKPIRITSLQSVVGGVFNNADILNLDYSVEYDVEKAAEEAKVYLLELKAKSGAVAYDRLKMRVDRASLTPTRDRGLRGERPAHQDAALQGPQGLRRRPAAPGDDGDRQPALQELQVGDALRQHQGAHAAGRSLHARLPAARGRAALGRAAARGARRSLPRRRRTRAG